MGHAEYTHEECRRIASTFQYPLRGCGLKYQWYVKNKNSKEFTKNTYTVTMSDSVNGRQLYCIITDAKDMTKNLLRTGESRQRTFTPCHDNDKKMLTWKQRQAQQQKDQPLFIASVVSAFTFFFVLVALCLFFVVLVPGSMLATNDCLS